MILRVLLRPLLSSATYRAWAWLIVGGALIMPYMMAGQVATGAYQHGDADQLKWYLMIFAGAVPVVALTGLVMPVRVMENAVARSLLGVGSDVLTSARGRIAAWFTVHLAVGGLLSGVTLALIPYAVLLALSPLLDSTRFDASFAWADGLRPLVGILCLFALVYLIAAAGAVLRRLAARLLAPTASERLAEAERAAHRLTEQNRLARELHDSIGHALSVVTIQAAAAGRVVESDPGFARQAMAAVEQTARTALADLDHVLGVLRSDGKDASSTAPRVGLEDVPDLIASTGLDVSYTLHGDIATVPVVVSREAYRIAQEGLTNAARHGDGGPVELEVRAEPDALRLYVRNAAGGGTTRPTGGRGLTGVRERAETLGGTAEAGPEDGRWTLAVRLPSR